MNDRTVWLTWMIFAAIYAGLALGKVPGLVLFNGRSSCRRR